MTGASGTRGAVSALWGPKSLDPLVDLELMFEVAPDKNATKRLRALRAEYDDKYEATVFGQAMRNANVDKGKTTITYKSK